MWSDSLFVLVDLCQHLYMAFFPNNPNNIIVHKYTELIQIILLVAQAREELIDKCGLMSHGKS